MKSFEVGRVYRNVYCLDCDWKVYPWPLSPLRENEYALMPVYNEKHSLLFGESPTDLAEIYTATDFDNWIDVTHIYELDSSHSRGLSNTSDSTV